MRELKRHPQWSADLTRVARRVSGKQLERCMRLIKALREDRRLPDSADDHSLESPYSAYRACKVLPDWIIVYRKEPGILILFRTGSHSELFEQGHLSTRRARRQKTRA